MSLLASPSDLDTLNHRLTRVEVVMGTVNESRIVTSTILSRLETLEKNRSTSKGEPPKEQKKTPSPKISTSSQELRYLSNEINKIKSKILNIGTSSGASNLTDLRRQIERLASEVSNQRNEIRQLKSELSRVNANH